MAVIKSKKPTKDGRSWYFHNRYKLNGKTSQYKSQLFALKRIAEEQERLFLINPIEYIENNSKKAFKKINLKKESKNSNLNEYFKLYCEYKIDFKKGSSIHEDKQNWKNHLSSELGNLHPEDITLTLIKDIHTSINKKINSRTNKPYATQTKNKIHSTLSEFFEYLKSDGLMEINFAKVIGHFENPNENKNSKKKIRYQTLEQFNLFMSEIENDLFWRTFFNFLFWHGCRIGEQRALRIKDIDFKNDLVRFHNTITKDENGHETIGCIKNNKERTIYLYENTKPYLLELINFYKEMDDYSDNWYVFGGSYYIHRSLVQRKLESCYIALSKKYPDKEIIQLSHHEFGRHSHASYLLNKGMGRLDIYDLIAARLGDTPDVIRNTYAHPYEDENNIKTKELLKF